LSDKKKILIIALTSLFALVALVAAFLHFSSLGKVVFGTIIWEHTPEVIIRTSYDGKYELVMEIDRKGGGVKAVKISIKDSETEDEVYVCDDFYHPYRAIDFGGSYWSKRSYDFWVVSGDVGTRYFFFNGDTWETGYPYLSDQIVEGKIVITMIADTDQLDDQKEKREVDITEVPNKVLKHINEGLQMFE